jgi:hypothetical protein
LTFRFVSRTIQWLSFTIVLPSGPRPQGTIEDDDGRAQQRGAFRLRGPLDDWLSFLGQADEWGRLLAVAAEEQQARGYRDTCARSASSR